MCDALNHSSSGDEDDGARPSSPLAVMVHHHLCHLVHQRGYDHSHNVCPPDDCVQQRLPHLALPASLCRCPHPVLVSLRRLRHGCVCTYVDLDMGYHGDVATYVPLLWKPCFCMRRSRGRMWCPGDEWYICRNVHTCMYRNY